MAGCFHQQFCQPGIRREIQHTVSIQIAKNISVVHPGWTHRQERHLRRSKPQCFPIQTHQSRLTGSAPSGQNHQTGRFSRNMEIIQIPFIVQKSSLPYPADKTLDKCFFLFFGYRCCWFGFLHRCLGFFRYFSFFRCFLLFFCLFLCLRLFSGLLFFFCRCRIQIISKPHHVAHCLIQYLLRQYRFLRLIFFLFHQRHELFLKHTHYRLWYKPQRIMVTADYIFHQKRVISIKECPGKIILLYMEISSTLADMHILKRLIFPWHETEETLFS